MAKIVKKGLKSSTGVLGAVLGSTANIKVVRGGVISVIVAPTRCQRRKR